VQVRVLGELPEAIHGRTDQDLHVERSRRHGRHRRLRR